MNEFELPELVVDLIRRIDGELFSVGRKFLEQAYSERTKAVADADQEFADVENSVREQIRREREELDQQAELCNQLRARIESAVAAARTHLYSISVVEPSQDDSAARLTAAQQLSGGGVDETELHLTALGIGLNEYIEDLGKEIATDIQAPFSALAQSQLPKYLPSNGGAQLLIALVSIGLSFIKFPLLFFWPALVFVSRPIRAHQLRRDWESTLDTSLAMLRTLEQLRRRAQESISNAIANAEANTVLPAKDKHIRAVAAIHERHTTNLAAAEVKLSELAILFAGECESLWEKCGFSATPWNSPLWSEWAPDRSPGFAARLGTFELYDPTLAAHLPKAMPRYSLPALMPFAAGRCVFLQADRESRQQAVEALQSLAVRALANIPPGKVKFTFIDPVALGESVADFMALGDFDANLIGGKAWSEPQHIEEQLRELTDHMETVIQKYLRKEFASIHDYNVTADEVAESFRFLLIFDFPTNFSESASKRLLSIVRNGPKCGVFTFIVGDPGAAQPYGFDLRDLEQAATVIRWEQQNNIRRPVWRTSELQNISFTPDSLLGHQNVVRNIVERSGKIAIEASRVEIPFEKLMRMSGLAQRGWWTASARETFSVPLGPSGARKVQHLTFGRGLAHHGLIVGRTGSGKTNLLHVIITAAALTYPPTELCLYLIDFKGGVGFKPYAKHRLPHAAVIAIESEREFGLSVLAGLDSELKRRFEIFRKAGVDNLADYKAKFPDQGGLPRVLLVVDEFQEFFSEDDFIAQEARTIFERIVRQGRSFGLHMLLGTQSLSGSAHLPESILGQMAVRIALPSSEADARMIFSDDNLAARSLNRPGEGIYNSQAGDVEGNNPFQVALFTDRDLDDYALEIANLGTSALVDRSPVVFEGNEPARFTECAEIRGMIDRASWSHSVTPGICWLGEPVALKPATACAFSREVARNLLIVDREESEATSLMNAAFLSLLMRYRPTSVKFYCLNGILADNEYASFPDKLRDVFDHQIEMLNRRTLPGVLKQLLEEARSRLEKPSSNTPAVFMFLYGIQRARDLRTDDDSFASEADSRDSSAHMFGQLVRDASETGIHVIACSDTVGNAKRVLGRSFREFGIRVGGRMSADDSHIFFDASDASRLDKPSRLLFADDNKPGVIEKFRPYSTPPLDWVEAVARQQRAWKTQEK